MKLTIEKVIIPLLPFYIFTMMCEMSAAGKLSVVLGSGVKIIGTGVALSLCYLVLQYLIAGSLSGKIRSSVCGTSFRLILRAFPFVPARR